MLQISESAKVLLVQRRLAASKNGGRHTGPRWSSSNKFLVDYPVCVLGEAFVFVIVCVCVCV